MKLMAQQVGGRIERLKQYLGEKKALLEKSPRSSHSHVRWLAVVGNVRGLEKDEKARVSTNEGVE